MGICWIIKQLSWSILRNIPWFSQLGLGPRRLRIRWYSAQFRRIIVKYIDLAKPKSGAPLFFNCWNLFCLGKCVRTAAKTMVIDRKYRKALPLLCLTSEPFPMLRIQAMYLDFASIRCYASYASYCVTINTGVFPGKICSDRGKNHGCGQKNTEGTSSTRFGVRTAAKCCELKRCADRISGRTEKMKCSKANS